MYNGFYFGYDPTWLLLIPVIIIAAIAQSRINSTYNKYGKYMAQKGMSGAAVARSILDGAGLNDVQVLQTQGRLADHYDPRKRVLMLSPEVYGSSSLSAVGVAAHECGHAIQHGEQYFPLQFRNAIVPVANIGSYAAWPLLILGLLMGSMNLVWIGIIVFSAVVVFQLVTLPVEFNASSRALYLLESGGYLTREELLGSKKVLNAAAMTYVAATLMSIMQLIRIIIIGGGGKRRN